MFLIELMEHLEPIVNFTHSTSFCIILCAGWLLTYLVMSSNNKKMRKQCDNLIKDNKVLLSELAEVNKINDDLSDVKGV